MNKFRLRCCSVEILLVVNKSLVRLLFVYAIHGLSLSELYALFVWTYQQNQQPSSSVFLSQQTSEQCFQHNKPAKRTGW
jgi:hypothetical protein